MDTGPGDVGKRVSHITCPQCYRALEFSGPRPLFCAFCGRPLPKYLDETTVVPATGPEAPTIAPCQPADSAIPEAAQLVGNYRLLRQLGSGGMGSVYEAEDSSGRRVALKLVGGGEPGSIDTLERFRREGRLASAISHPRCVFVLAADEDCGRPYIVMELMPGRTLADEVRERGPLPPAEAVAKILDVLDGLHEAHRHGVVHRDIKPSNCFLDKAGRVKVGDFGLSKSLSGDSRLTVSGSFLGTPLFAAPEQVRGEELGVQSDVYSLAATLYCLLTGRAPFEGGDAAATLARIAADPVPSMLLFRPELPPGLDRAVLRGLERDRRRRYRDMQEFREALSPFVPGQQQPAGRGVRFAAFLVDLVLLKMAGMLFFVAFIAAHQISIEPNPQGLQRQALRQFLVRTLLWLGYFVVSEGVWGSSVGKWLLRLRVTSAAGAERAGWKQVLLRSAVFYLLLSLEEISIIPWTGVLDYTSREGQEQARRVSVAVQPFSLLGYGLLCLTMRRRNGWRGLHEFASGTRVVQLPEPGRRRVFVSRGPATDLIRPPNVPERIGPFEVRGALRREENDSMLLADDKGLGRPVLLWLRPQTAEPLSAARRGCSRTTRLRWLAGGEQHDWQWDAFPAPAGDSLPNLVASTGPLRWSEAKPLLEQLTEELAAAEDESTLPADLTPDFVWLQPDGGVILLDSTLHRVAKGETPGDHVHPADLAFLTRVARLALEGSGSGNGRRIRAVAPEHATYVLDQLTGAKGSYSSVRDFRAALEAIAAKPTEVTPSRRAAQVVVQAGAVFSGLFTMLLAAWLGGLPTLILLRESTKAFPRAVDELQAASAANLLGSMALPDPVNRATAAYRFEAESALGDKIRHFTERADRELEARLGGANWLERTAYQSMEEMIERAQSRMDLDRPGKTSRDELVNTFRAEAFSEDQPTLAEIDDAVAKTDTLLRTVVLVALLAWPALWVLAAFVFRGGLAIRLMELSLVRGDGRRAGRFRCAGRALLIWLPPTLLLFAAVVLDGWSWSAAGRSGAALVSWLAEFLRWSCLGLLALYPVLAIRNPERGPQDRLAGTYLVPR
jgi:hypothetical protein